MVCGSCISTTGAAFMVEIVDPAVGISEAMVGGKKIGRSVLGRVVDQGS